MTMAPWVFIRELDLSLHLMVWRAVLSSRHMRHSKRQLPIFCFLVRSTPTHQEISSEAEYCLQVASDYSPEALKSYSHFAAAAVAFIACSVVLVPGELVKQNLQVPPMHLTYGAECVQHQADCLCM
jgi:hypothetical protein